MLSRPGPGSSGYNFESEYLDFDCTLVLHPTEACPKGQALCRSVTDFSTETGADKVCLPTRPHAGAIYGVYMGDPIPANTSTVNTFHPIIARIRGHGKVLVNAPTGGNPVVVGGALQVTNAGTPAIRELPDEPPPKGKSLGIALATDSINTVGGVLVAINGPTRLISADILIS